ncbi:MAG: sigma-70 family RNA polymerase sigma factor [Planctomycetota bacterium]|nr:MAG: sigma-70 family RNA polymerase sigma factor [Planctomycetota bacterium]REJ97925.1 MAG: sigma-70 family RNA polymerase sigma factor [Planctomycetota bacterium]REK25604.1 MAG: sigma-70 family RNA polymerase sigma factor [Planctomycetota bacterium]REK31685.1 MAG: sigma-70 family RNA polymerase sigma factor [Planctomycetota bacterium]
MSENGQATRLAWVSAALDRFEGRLLRYAQRITRDEERARDVVQETFLKLCKEDPQTLNGRLAQWLYTVCRNSALDVRRKESRISVLEGRLPDPRQSRETDPAESAESHDSVCLILEEIDHLTQNQQECIRLKFQHGLSYREISAVTGLSLSNVGFLIHIGLKRVRERVHRRAPP